VPTKIHHFWALLLIRSIMKGPPFPALKCLFLAVPLVLRLLRN